MEFDPSQPLHDVAVAGIFDEERTLELLDDSERWRLVQADCIEHMATMPEASVDLSVFSPPFPSLYAYTDSESDIGNSEDFRGDAKLHLSFFYRQLARIVKPG